MRNTPTSFPSWGNYPIGKPAEVYSHQSNRDPIPESDYKILPRGSGRSYGDSCLNHGQMLLLTKQLNRILEFNVLTGEICCESGVTFEQLLSAVVPAGWFPPVTPGTKFITVGGAVSNDVHGKNHHKSGTFGRFVRRLDLLRSDGERILCSPKDDPNLFRATIAGLGLTGLILTVTFQLKKISSHDIMVSIDRFNNLQSFFALSEKHADDEYTVSWIDSLSRGKHLGRGIFISGNHASEESGSKVFKNRSLSIPFFLPSCLLNRYSVKAFNNLYFRLVGKPTHYRRQYYDPFFFPLDNILNWNRIYGRRGFIQYQCVLPANADHSAFLSHVSSSGFGSFLSVLKSFGDIPSEGIMSFPMPGLTIAMDFPVSPGIFAFLDELDKFVMASGGRVYIAKDSRMSSEAFHAFYPQADQFIPYIDPRFSSSFWRRVTGD